ncbi:MAG: extracellular solute-binding protein [Acidimicrobiia bacterium]|nr:extracellular solute-binding protein [Acidimicrobiia bacterium]
MSRRLLAVFLAAGVLSACGGDGGAGTLVLYTTVTQNTVDTVVAAFEADNPGVAVEVFRAPTGEVNARIAADLREGDIQADVLWLTDPLSMQQWEARGVLRVAAPDATAVPAEYRQDRFWGTRVLNLVVVRHRDGPAVASWDDLVSAAATGGVVLPDPAFAGSAFAAVAYFAIADDYGFAYLEALHAAGAAVVAAPGDVITAVAEGQYAAGITLDVPAADAVADGSPIEIVWPSPGAIAIYSPIAVTSAAGAATDFVSFVLGIEGQTAIASTGWQPVHPGVPWEVGGPQVTLDWEQAFDRQQELLDAFRAIFGG